MYNINKKEARIAIMLLITGGIIYFLVKVKKVLLPFALGVILTYLFNPLITFLKKHNFPHSWAIYILIIMFLFIVIVTTLIIIPLFLDELEGLSDTLPKYVNFIEDYFNNIYKEYRRISLPLFVKEIIDKTLNKIEVFIINFMESLTETILNSISMIFSILIAPIISYYLLKDMDKIKKSLLKKIPTKRRRLVLKLGIEINKIFVGYLRGQIWVSIIVGILSAIGLFYLRVKFYLILGIISGLTNMIPYFGPIIGAIPAILVALLSSPLKALGVTILYILIQQVESSIISPKIMSKKVGIHPLTTIFALLAGAELFGIWGLLFAVPLAGSLKVIVTFIWSQLFLENMS